MAVEFAVICPLLATMVFGIVEYGYIFLVQQTLTNAAREGCRVAVLQTTADEEQIEQRVAKVMDAAGVTDYSVSISDTDAEQNEIESYTIEVSVPYSSVSLTGFFGPRDNDLKGVCTMRKEGWTPPDDA